MNLQKHIANINQLIEEQIENIHKYIPEWIKWEYIKKLFIMPGCSAGTNFYIYKDKKRTQDVMDKIHEYRKDFYKNKDFYPYGTYLNWNPSYRKEDAGNILFNDNKFLKLLYASNNDIFNGEQYVIDAKEEIKNSIYDFVEQAINIAIYVDCENVDPYSFAATLTNLDQSKIKKIKKVVLYDDANTTNAWDILQEVLNLEVEHLEVERVKDDKSLVDHALAIGVTKSFFEEKIESVMLASSDSDFWSLIRYLPEIRFFVMNETKITSNAVLEKLNDYNIPHCCMDEFAQDSIQAYKNKVLKNNLQIILNEFNEEGRLEFLNTDDIVQNVFRRAGIGCPYRQFEKEKQDFYNKYIKKLKLKIDEYRNLKIVLE
jgi:hypothetical protein